MTSPSDPTRWAPLPALDPRAGRQPDPSDAPRPGPAPLSPLERIVEQSRQRAFVTRLDRASAAFALGDELRARQWINEAAAAAGYPPPWPSLGRPKQSPQRD